MIAPSRRLDPSCKHLLRGRGVEASLLCKRNHLSALVRCQDLANGENAWRKVLPFHVGGLA